MGWLQSRRDGRARLVRHETSQFRDRAAKAAKKAAAPRVPDHRRARRTNIKNNAVVSKEATVVFISSGL